MLLIKDEVLNNAEVRRVGLNRDRVNAEYFDLWIDLNLVVMIYNTLTQSVYIFYKAHYPEKSFEDIQDIYNSAKDFALDDENKYLNQTFVVTPTECISIKNTKFIGIISNVIKYMDGKEYLADKFKDQATRFENNALFKEQPIVLKEIIKSDVRFVVKYNH